MSKIQKLLKNKWLRPFARAYHWSFRYFEPGALWGVPIRIHTAAFFHAALIGLIRHPVSALSIIVGLVIHEYAHIWMAKSYDIKTKQIDINLMGAVAVMDGSEAFEKIFNDGDIEVRVAAVGPLTSGLLASIGFAGASISMLFGWNLAYFIFYEFAFMNIVLAGFNVLPIFPLDGGRVLRGFLHHNYFKDIDSKAKLNEVMGTIGRIAKWGSLGMILGSPIGAIVLFNIFSSLQKETKFTDVYVKHQKRMRDLETEQRVMDMLHGIFREDWWNGLGLSRRPHTLAEAKGAYRARVNQVHPDRGGSADQMRRANQSMKSAKIAFGA